MAEAKLRAAEADRQNLQSERTDAHKRLQEMTEKVLTVTTEKDVLARGIEGRGEGGKGRGVYIHTHTTTGSDATLTLVQQASLISSRLS